VTWYVINGSKLGSLRRAVRKDDGVNNNEMAALLQELVAIPTISSDPSRRPDITRSAERIAAELVSRNFAVTIAEDGGALPTVIATRGISQWIESARVSSAAGASSAAEATTSGSGSAHVPTVLLYSHHDVQPTGDPAAWSSDPFTPTRRGTVVFGRGAGDNTAGIVAHLAAIDAIADMQDPPGIVVVVDGGEEIGSPAFGDVLAEHLGHLDPDLIIVNDGINYARGVPSLTTSLRGLLDVDVTVSIMEEPTHSGIYGGGVVDAISALARLLATLHSDDGSVAVAGLDAVGVHRAVGADGEPMLTEAQYRERLGLYPDVVVAGGDALTGRLWASVAIAVIGIDAPSIAESANVIVPSARARLSVRLPPGIGADAASAALQEHLRARRPFGARVTIGVLNAVEPWSNATHPALVANALERAWGVGVVEMGGGGGIPVVSDFSTAFPRATIAITAICDPESNVHGIDENVDLVELQRAVDAEADVLRGVGRLGA